MRSSRTLRGAGCGIACLLAMAGCSSDDDSPEDANADPRPTERQRAVPQAPEEGRPVMCRADEASCRVASGRIIYVERVDPDGDGDAHFVLVSRQSITAPRLSVIDVKKSLRPSPLPGPGEWLSAAGPVHRGSYGQRQIEAVRLRVARRG